MKVNNSKLEDQRIVIYGSGSAGLGIARQLRDAMRLTTGSRRLSEEDASKRFYLIDKHGLIKKSLGKDKVRDEIDEAFVRDDEEDWGEGETSLLDVVKKAKATVLIGTSTQAGAFTEEVVREMAKHSDRPIIFPLSNPTRLCEVKPEDANKWTEGKALMATGSPFPPVPLPGQRDKKRDIAECNNALIYPGLGLGTILSKAKVMTDKMIVAGANRLSELAPALKDEDGALLPDFGDAAEVNFEIALAVLDQAIEDGVANVDLPKEKEKRREYAEKRRWRPQYPSYEYDPKGLL